MSDVRVRNPGGTSANPAAQFLIALVDQGDGTHAPAITTQTGADLKVRSPWPAFDDPTNFPLLGLHDNGDGTYSLIVTT